MSREKLALELGGYRSWDGREEAFRQDMHSFLLEEADCFLRTHSERHFTASALVWDQQAKKVLLMHHRKLNRWLQPGGHADGETDLLAVAQREVWEETGLENLDAVYPLPFDLDVHWIPARKEDPAHRHYDVRYLLLAKHTIPLTPNSESKALTWFDLGEARALADGPSILRMLDKLESGWHSTLDRAERL